MSQARGAPSKLLIVLAFLSVYFCWSATYTAMRVGDTLLPVNVLAATRFLAGSGIMLGFCALRGRKIFYPAHITWRLMILGLLLLFGGNLGLLWSENYLPSGLAALIKAVIPLYVVMIEMVLPDGDRLRRQGYIGLALGFCALSALIWPDLHLGAQGHPIQALAILAILAGAFSFSSGSVLSRRMNLPVDPLVAAGWEMFAAGAANAICATLLWRWPHAVWNWKSVGSVGYLVMFGSLLGFSCYVWLIAHVPVSKVATYAYVNPMIAVLLGAIILHEKLVSTEYVGMVAIIASVALVTSSRLVSGKSTAEVECAAVEAEA